MVRLLPVMLTLIVYNSIYAQVRGRVGVEVWVQSQPEQWSCCPPRWPRCRCRCWPQHPAKHASCSLRPACR